MTLCGIGKLAEAEMLGHELSIREINDLLDKLVVTRPDAQAIGNCLFSITRLIVANRLQAGKLNTEKVQILLKTLVTRTDLDHISFGSALYSLGILVNAKLYDGTFAAVDIQKLLQRGARLIDLDARGISNSLYGLKLLVEDEAIVFQSDDKLVITPLIVRLTQMVRDKKAPANEARGAFILAALIYDKTPERTDFTKHLTNLVALADQGLSVNYLHPSEAAQLIHAFVAFAAMHSEFDELFSRTLDALTVPITSFTERLQTQLRDDLKALRRVAPTWHRWLHVQLHSSMPKPSDVSQNISPSVPASQRTPTALSAKSAPSKLADRSRMDDSGERFSSKPTSATSKPSQPAKARTVDTSKAASSKPTSSTSKPKQKVLAPEIKKEAMKDKIFAAIVAKDQQQLEYLLGIHLRPPVTGTRTPSALPPNPHTRNKRHRDDTNAGDVRDIRQRGSRDDVLLSRKRNPLATILSGNSPPRLQRDYSVADSLVRNFLIHTPAEALKVLIQQREAKYFSLLIHACSPHQRYQLAMHCHLHLILLHLKDAELSDFIDSLISPSAIYIDHKALLAVIDALTIRILGAQTERTKKSMVDLQLKLVNRGIDFHGNHHRHVVANLLATKQHITARQCQLLCEDLDERMRTQQSQTEQPRITPSRISVNQTSQTPTLRPSSPLASMQSRPRTPSVTGQSPGIFVGRASQRSTPRIQTSLADGNCLYNACALGIRDSVVLQHSLISCLQTIDMTGFFLINATSALPRMDLRIHPSRRESILQQFLRDTLVLSPEDIQKRL
ncbi:MAG: hypothetical protein K2Q33_07430, partial [Gammaproteobacteria bacterium]|nr:hypothetical protein [Gammaproteobacteria bacterium]